MYYSNLLAVLIALTAAVPFLQLGHGKFQLNHRRNFSLIIERTQTCLRKEFYLDHGIISFNLLTEKTYTIIEKQVKLLLSTASLA